MSADAADWIHAAVAARAPDAVLCLDPFHVVAWATKALDEVRRGLVNELRKDNKPDQAKSLKGSRWALLKNPHELTVDQRSTLAGIAPTNTNLRMLTPRAYGFHSPDALIALAMLTRGGLRPELPGRP